MISRDTSDGLLAVSEEPGCTDHASFAAAIESAIRDAAASGRTAYFTFNGRHFLIKFPTKNRGAFWAILAEKSGH